MTEGITVCRSVRALPDALDGVERVPVEGASPVQRDGRHHQRQGKLPGRIRKVGAAWMHLGCDKTPEALGQETACLFGLMFSRGVCPW